jgi:chromate transporter
VPVWSSLNPAALALTIAAIVAVFRFRVGTLAVLAACAAVGIALRLGGVA